MANHAAALLAFKDKELAKAVNDLGIKSALETGHPIDVALFGRMVADIPQLNVDAAVQVAHALSTHAVETEFDYFTAVDDENPKEDTGAGMISTIEFNSSTLYRYATVGVPQLLENLGGDIDATLRALQVFLTTFVRSMPTGHQNSFAHHTTPSLVTIALRTDQPVNLVSAFERPVRGREGVVEESINRFAAELTQAGELWGLRPVHCASAYAGGSDQARAALGASLPFTDLIESSVEAVRAQLAVGA